MMQEVFRCLTKGEKPTRRLTNNRDESAPLEFNRETWKPHTTLTLLCTKTERLQKQALKKLPAIKPQKLKLGSQLSRLNKISVISRLSQETIKLLSSINKIICKTCIQVISSKGINFTFCGGQPCQREFIKLIQHYLYLDAYMLSM